MKDALQNATAAVARSFDLFIQVLLTTPAQPITQVLGQIRPGKPGIAIGCSNDGDPICATASAPLAPDSRGLHGAVSDMWREVPAVKLVRVLALDEPCVVDGLRKRMAQRGLLPGKGAGLLSHAPGGNRVK